MVCVFALKSVLSICQDAFGNGEHRGPRPTTIHTRTTVLLISSIEGSTSTKSTTSKFQDLSCDIFRVGHLVRIIDDEQTTTYYAPGQNDSKQYPFAV